MHTVERRQSARQKSFLRGCIYFNNRRSAVDCLIRDISEHGARLTFSDTISIPDCIELYIPQKEQTLQAVVKRRHGMDVGVAFSDPARAAAPATSDLAALSERVQKLESEVAVMRRLLKRLRAEVAGPENDAA